MSLPPRGSVQTVPGPVLPAALGATMLHEHVPADLPHIAKPPDDPALLAIA